MLQPHGVQNQMHQLHAFTISSLYPVTPRKMSTFTMSVLDNTALIEGRGANGGAVL